MISMIMSSAMVNDKKSSFDDFVSASVVSDVEIQRDASIINIEDVPVLDLARSLLDCLLLTAVTGKGESFLWDSGERVAIRLVENDVVTVEFPVGNSPLEVTFGELLDDIQKIHVLSVQLLVQSVKADDR